MTGNSVKRGFTLIELLLVLTILAILVGVVILSIGNVPGTARKTVYTTIRQQIQTSVVSYAIISMGNYPLTGNTAVIDGKTLGIIDVCALLSANSPGGLLGKMPEGLISYQGNDNCDSLEYDCSCDTAAHYVWAIDVSGTVHSLCIDTDLNNGGCKNTSSDGFQRIWP